MNYELQILIYLQIYELWDGNINGPAKLGIMGFKLLMGRQTYQLWATNSNGLAKY